MSRLTMLSILSISTLLVTVPSAWASKVRVTVTPIQYLSNSPQPQAVQGLTKLLGQRLSQTGQVFEIEEPPNRQPVYTSVPKAEPSAAARTVQTFGRTNAVTSANSSPASSKPADYIVIGNLKLSPTSSTFDLVVTLNGMHGEAGATAQAQGHLDPKVLSLPSQESDFTSVGFMSSPTGLAIVKAMDYCAMQLHQQSAKLKMHSDSARD